MPEVVRGSRASVQIDRPDVPVEQDAPPTPTSPAREGRNVHFSPETPNSPLESPPPLGTHRTDSGLSIGSGPRKSFQSKRRKSSDVRPDQDVYYDSRAATKKEFKRRASTLQDYYAQNPELLPQLPFTWKRGWKRWKLFLTIALMVVDACVVPIVLYYTMTFAGHVQGFIGESLQMSVGTQLTHNLQSLQSWPPSGVALLTSNLPSALGDSSRRRISSGLWIQTVVGHSTSRTGSSP